VQGGIVCLRRQLAQAEKEATKWCEHCKDIQQDRQDTEAKFTKLQDRYDALQGIHTTIETDYKSRCHDMKTLRQAMGADGSDLPQLLAKWDELQEENTKLGQAADWLHEDNRQSKEENKRLQAIVGKQLLADGVVAQHGMEVWYPDDRESSRVTFHVGGEGGFTALKYCYSSKEAAARAAKENSKSS
jgi:hypothetical protein